MSCFEEPVPRQFHLESSVFCLFVKALESSVFCLFVKAKQGINSYILYIYILGCEHVEFPNYLFHRTCVSTS